MNIERDEWLYLSTDTPDLARARAFFGVPDDRPAEVVGPDPNKPGQIVVRVRAEA